MTPATREIVAKLAEKASGNDGHWLIGLDEIERFWSLAMEHAAGICDGVSSNCESWEDGGQDGMIAADQCAYAIREAAK